MGAACCTTANPEVPVPLPATLQQWDKFSPANAYRCVAYLNEVRIADMNKPHHQQQLCGPYAVEVVSKLGQTKAIAVTDVQKEVFEVYVMLKEQTKKRNKNKKLEDVRRESALCMSNLHLLHHAGLVFRDELDTKFVSAQLEAPMSTEHVVELCELFEDVNRSRSGAITLEELGAWVSKHSPSITQSVFFILFTEIVATDVLHFLRCIEFIAAVDRYCILSHDQLVEHVFNGLADTTTADGEMAIDILGLMDRFPILTADGAGEGGKMPLLKTMAKVYNARLANPSDSTVEARLVTWEEFVKIHHNYSRAFEQLFELQSILRVATLGHRVWNQRRRLVEKAMMEHGATRAGVMSKQFTLREVREVNSYYSVRPLDPSEIGPGGTLLTGPGGAPAPGAEEAKWAPGEGQGFGPPAPGAPPAPGPYVGGPPMNGDVPVGAGMPVDRWGGMSGAGPGPGPGPAGAGGAAAMARAATFHMGNAGNGMSFAKAAERVAPAGADFENAKLKTAYSWGNMGAGGGGRKADFRGAYNDSDGSGGDHRYDDGRGQDGPPWSAKEQRNRDPALEDSRDGLPGAFPKLNLSQSSRLEEDQLGRSDRLLDADEAGMARRGYDSRFTDSRGPPPMRFDASGRSLSRSHSRSRSRSRSRSYSRSRSLSDSRSRSRSPRRRDSRSLSSSRTRSRSPSPRR